MPSWPIQATAERSRLPQPSDDAEMRTGLPKGPLQGSSGAGMIF